MIPYYNETLKPVVDAAIKGYTSDVDLMTAFKMMQDDTSGNSKIWSELSKRSLHSYVRVFEFRSASYVSPFEYALGIHKPAYKCTIKTYCDAYDFYSSIYRDCLDLLYAVAYRKKDNGYCYSNLAPKETLVGKDTAILDKVTYFNNNIKVYMRSLLNFPTYFDNINLLENHVKKQEESLYLLYKEKANIYKDIFNNGIPLL